MPCLTKVSLRHYNWEIRCLCMEGGGGGGLLAYLILFILLTTPIYPCQHLYTPILPIHLCRLCIPLYTFVSLHKPLYTSVYPCKPLSAFLDISAYISLTQS